MTDFARQRAEMVERQLRARGITDAAVLAAFSALPREAFVAEEDKDSAYGDHPLPISCAQTISQPYVVALTLQAAGIGPDDKVLEVGAGSGYVAALLGLIARDVIAVERHPELAGHARERLAALGYANVRIVEGDGTLGCPVDAPFDAIVASATGSHIPRPWIDQLKTGGRLVMPLGDPLGAQELIRAIKHADGQMRCEPLGGVRFVPLIGAEGFAPE